ncbi:MAG: hypothetical protein IPK26_14960 [Planctomycetes bacterium]|nr:hypothetical protein [Planctomycetota bacterium]
MPFSEAGSPALWDPSAEPADPFVRWLEQKLAPRRYPRPVAQDPAWSLRPRALREMPRGDVVGPANLDRAPAAGEGAVREAAALEDAVPEVASQGPAAPVVATQEANAREA